MSDRESWLAALGVGWPVVYVMPDPQTGQRVQFRATITSANEHTIRLSTGQVIERDTGVNPFNRNHGIVKP